MLPEKKGSPVSEVFRIKDWEKHFENAQSRKYRNISWVPIPNKHDGDGYSSLVLGHPNGPAHYAAWITIIQVASKCEPRGTLLRDGSQPHTSASLARKTRLPEELFAEAIPRLIDAEVGWMEVVSDTGVTTTLPADSQCATSGVVPPYAPNRPEQTSTEGKRTEKEGSNKPCPAAPNGTVDIHAVFNHYKTHHPRAHRKPNSKSKEWKAIKARLADGYTVDDLKAAIDGCHRSPFHQGDNEKGIKYDSLELIMRDSSKVTQFMEVPKGGRNKPVKEKFDAGKLFKGANK